MTGASFVIFDGALKHSNEKFIVTVIEDGIVVRMQSETMEEAVRSLLAGQDFHLESANMAVDIVWRDEFMPTYSVGALISPIDGMDLTVSLSFLNRTKRFRESINMGWS